MLKGAVKIDLINGAVNLNCMDSIFLPHYNFHGIGSFSDESFIIEIEIYNHTIQYTDKNDLLRINDQYNRTDNKYQSSVTMVTEQLDEYGYFKLTDNLVTQICDVDVKVVTIQSNQVPNISQLQPFDYFILLKGTIYQNGKYIKEGSIITSFENMQFIEDEITVLTLYKIDCQDDRKIIYNTEQLKIVVDELKRNHKKIVLTSGCFDILHVGHIKNVIESKKMGDILMVCISNDSQIKKLKGESRPINNYQDRIDLFKIIKYVDYIILYDERNIDTEETLGEIMRLVDPFIWAKGSDYNANEILKKHPYLKNIKLIQNIENKSTTKVIEKIENNK